MRVLLTALFIVFIAGCATAPARPIPTPLAAETRGIRYTVRPGDTLWSISRIYGVEMDAILKANSIRDSSAIEGGQVLTIPAVFKPKENVRSYSYSNESFIWPVKGHTIARFGDKIDNAINKGIDIMAPDGTDVKAARSGHVVYCDSHLKGFGKTIILDHGDNYQTVYSYNSEILVKVGDKVSQRDIIAKVGRGGRAKEASLHFEVRKDGKPRNPMYYLSR